MKRLAAALLLCVATCLDVLAEVFIFLAVLTVELRKLIQRRGIR